VSSLVCPGCRQEVADEDLEAGICGLCGAALGSFRTKEGLPLWTKPEKQHDTSPPYKSRPTIRDFPIEIIRGLIGWATLQTSLLLVFFGLLLLIASGLATLVLLAAGVPLSGCDSPTLLIVGTTVGLMLGSVLILIGILDLCALPASSGARGWGMACSILLLVCSGSVLFHRFLLKSPPGWLAAVLPTLEILLGLLGITCYLLALRGAARALGNQSLDRAFTVYLLCFLLCSGGAGLFQVSGVLEPFPPESILIGLLVPLLLLLVGLLVLVELLRRSTIQAISKP
jgi:hypothetical protein